MQFLERAFMRMGARLKFKELASPWLSRRERITGDFAIDVERDAHGEFFQISRLAKSATEFLVLEVQARDRQLLLLSRKGSEKHRYLLGFEERHWFVAGIPEVTPVSRVVDAKQALKPGLVHSCELGVRANKLHRRVNHARVRQGEWFFVPASDVRVSRFLVLRDEPLRRGWGKAHMCEELYRLGGETVYTAFGYPNGLTEVEYRALGDGERKSRTWRVMRRNPTVYVRGRVRHRDHETVVLNGWHQVVMNTENLSHAMRNVAFLD
jgi:hypothetical protein